MTDPKTKLSIEQRIEFGAKGVGQLLDLLDDLASTGRIAPVEQVELGARVSAVGMQQLANEIQLRQTLALEHIAEELAALRRHAHKTQEIELVAPVGISEVVTEAIARAQIRRQHRQADEAAWRAGQAVDRALDGIEAEGEPRG